VDSVRNEFVRAKRSVYLERSVIVMDPTRRRLSETGKRMLKEAGVGKNDDSLVRQCVGELYKRRSRLGFVSWSGPLHFELSGLILSYYKKPGLLRPNGMVMITSDTKVEIAVCKGKTNCFKVSTPTTTWLLQAQTRKERESWLQAIGNAKAFSKKQETPLCAGELDKLAIASHRNWKKRYIELYQNPPQIYYYRKGCPKDGTALPDGIMSLYEGAVVRTPTDVPDETLALGKVRRELTFKVFSGHKLTFHAQAPSKAELDRWTKAIRMCCNDALPRVQAVASTCVCFFQLLSLSNHLLFNLFCLHMTHTHTHTHTKVHGSQNVIQHLKVSRHQVDLLVLERLEQVHESPPW